MSRLVPLYSIALCLGLAPTLYSQEAPAEPAEESSPPPAASPSGDTIQDMLKTGEAEVAKIAKEVDADPRAQEISAGILKPIYQLAEQIAFPAFYWLAFALMVTGVTSYALQLVLAKLVVLTRMHFNLTEILSDALGLAISLIGLVLTTQAAAENSTFAQSAWSVLSATALGLVLGFLFYLWGQRLELRAASVKQVRG